MRPFQSILEAENVPRFLYHGTNPVSATLIVVDDVIKADHPVDADAGPVVCSTSDPRMARSFAIEFARVNSEYDVGFVFKIDTTQVSHRIYPYDAETASDNENEYRIQGDVNLSAVVGIKLVGKGVLLRRQNFLQRMYDENRRFLIGHHGMDFEDFCSAIRTLLGKVS